MNQSHLSMHHDWPGCGGSATWIQRTRRAATMPESWTRQRGWAGLHPGRGSKNTPPYLSYPYPLTSLFELMMRMARSHCRTRLPRARAPHLLCWYPHMLTNVECTTRCWPKSCRNTEKECAQIWSDGEVSSRTIPWVWGIKMDVRQPSLSTWL